MRIRQILVRWQCLFCVLWACSGNGSVYSQVVDVEGNIGEPRTQFLTAKPGHEKGDAAKQLFPGASPDEVQRACFDKDDSIALVAAWRRLAMQMDARFVSFDRSASAVPMPREVTWEFLGFVEGRLQVPAPDAWARSLLTSVYTFRSGAIFLTTTIGAEAQNRRMPLPTLFTGSRHALPIVSIVIHEEDLAQSYAAFTGLYEGDYEGVDATAYLPDEVVKQLEEVRRRRNAETVNEMIVTGIAVRDRAVIAMPGAGPGRETLICLATKDAKAGRTVYWKTQMDSSWTSSYKGQGAFTQFRVKDDRIYLFHCNSGSIGIECISFKDGSRLFSFNSRTD